MHRLFRIHNQSGACLVATTFSRVASHLGGTEPRCTVLAVEASHTEMATVLAFLDQITQLPDVYITSDGIDATLGPLSRAFWPCLTATAAQLTVTTLGDLGLHDFSDFSLAARCRFVIDCAGVAASAVMQAVMQRHLGFLGPYDTALEQCMHASTPDATEMCACVGRLVWC